MKKLIERIKTFTQDFLNAAASILAGGFVDEKPLLIPTSVQSTAYYVDKRDPYRH